jgi:hypothetical protein
LLFQKPARSIADSNIVAVIAGFVNPDSYIRRKNYRKNAERFTALQAETCRAPYVDEKKKPGSAGLP